jgi:kynureninase
LHGLRSARERAVRSWPMNSSSIARGRDQLTILVAADEFPTDRYIAAGVADALGGRVGSSVLVTWVHGSRAGP